jgi:hypothetical protein
MKMIDGGVMTEAVRTSETSVNFYETTRPHPRILSCSTRVCLLDVAGRVGDLSSQQTFQENERGRTWKIRSLYTSQASV